MGNEKQFITLLKPVKRQLLYQMTLKEAQSSFALLGVLTFLLVTAASIWIIPFLHLYFFVIFGCLTLFFLMRVSFRKPGLKEAAEIYNEFVPDDRVLTAYSYLGNDGAIQQLQLTDAISHMKRVHQDVLKRKKNILFPKYIATGLLFAATATILFYMVDDKIELAKQQEKEIELVNQTEKELKEKAEKEQEPEVKKTLEETKENISEKKSAEEALKELQKQSKEIELQSMKEKEKQLALENWEQMLKNNDLSQLANLLNQKNFAEFEKELRQTNDDWQSLNQQQQKAFNQLTQKEQKLTEQELEALIKELEEALQSEEVLKQLAAAQSAIQKAGMNLQNGMIANGMPPSEMAFAPPGQPGNGNHPPQGTGQNDNGSESGNSQNVQSGSGNDSGSGSGSGNGSGSGTGSGSGSGSGSGAGAGSGAGGNGLGSGAGVGQGSREFVTIPERLDGEDNVERDAGQLGEGQSGRQFEGTGPVLKGSVRPYREVFESYEQAYRESTERYQIPVDLEEIVKDYFSNIDPNKE